MEYTVYLLGNICNILTSDPADLSNKKCTCVNNRCIRSKISGDTLTVDGLSWVQMRRSLKLVDSKQLYNLVPQEVRVSLEFGVSLLQFEAVRTRPSWELGPQGPQLSSPAERERSAAKEGGTGGQYVAVFVQSPTYLTHITLSQPFRIRCERYIFLKNWVSFVIIVLTMFQHVYVYMYYTYSLLWLRNISKSLCLLLSSFLRLCAYFRLNLPFMLSSWTKRIYSCMCMHAHARGCK